MTALPTSPPPDPNAWVPPARDLGDFGVGEGLRRQQAPPSPDNSPRPTEAKLDLNATAMSPALCRVLLVDHISATLGFIERDAQLPTVREKLIKLATEILRLWDGGHPRFPRLAIVPVPTPAEQTRSIAQQKQPWPREPRGDLITFDLAGGVDRARNEAGFVEAFAGSVRAGVIDRPDVTSPPPQPPAPTKPPAPVRKKKPAPGSKKSKPTKSKSHGKPPTPPTKPRPDAAAT